MTIEYMNAQAMDNEPGLLIALTRLLTALLPAVIDLQHDGEEEEGRGPSWKLKVRVCMCVFLYLCICDPRYPFPRPHTLPPPKKTHTHIIRNRSCYAP